ncbi:hypothetical protein JCM8547_001871 [Rhodosporidiobolus lusitaniae]
MMLNAEHIAVEAMVMWSFLPEKDREMLALMTMEQIARWDSRVPDLTLQGLVQGSTYRGLLDHSITSAAT